MLFPMVSTNARWPPRPTHVVRTKVATIPELPAAAAAKTRIAGQTVPVFVGGQFPPLFRLPPVPVYQRRVLGLNFNTSLDVGYGWKDSICWVVRLKDASPFRLPRQPMS